MKAEKAGSYRYRILAMLFVATTINYMDRSIIGVLAPTLQYKVFHWSDIDYANIMMAFKVAYALGMLVMGGIMDRFGTRIGYAVAIITWSVFGALHAAVRPAFSLIGFSVARFGLGLGEAGNFPAAIKAVAEWFPRKDRAFATGIFNAGSNVGAVLAPLLIPLVVMADGTNWQYAFLLTSIFSLIWVVIWLRIYKSPERHPGVSREELAYIRRDSEVETGGKISWFRLLPVKETWAFSAAKLTDAVWWFYLFWGGKFLFDKFGLNIRELAIPLIIIYVVADIGSIYGGWLSSYFINRGWSVNKGRKITMLICACAVLPVSFVTMVPTSFKVDANFISRLETATYTYTETVEENGKIRDYESDRPFPPEVINRLKGLDGRTYDAAKNLVEDVRETIGEAQTSLLENPIIEHARANRYYWIAIVLIALAAAGHTAWMANAFTLVSDLFPKKAVGSVTGIGGMIGAIAGLLADFSLGQVLQSSGPSGYFFAFFIAGVSYVMILGAIHLITPGLRAVDENLEPQKP